MQMNRLFEIIYILLNKKSATARELAERFEVSTRTIYRDIDTLSAAGIPIYARKGQGGGIQLLDGFVLNKSMLSEIEQQDILASLQGLQAVHYPNVQPVLEKLSILFHEENTDWIQVDFSSWGSGAEQQEKFELLKTAILRSTVVRFAYFSSYGQTTERVVEPIKLFFKSNSWYLHAFCHTKQDCRFFKISRMKDLCTTESSFVQQGHTEVFEKPDHSYQMKMVNLVLKIDPQMAYRVYDEFSENRITKNTDGSFEVHVAFPEDEWVYGYILSFGCFIEVLEPRYMREIIVQRLENSLKQYFE